MIVAVLMLIAAFVMVVSRSDVTQTVSTSEAHAVRNAVDLVRRDIEARWAALLNDKISAVRGGRRQLQQLGGTVQSVLMEFSELANRGAFSVEDAKAMARTWINELTLGHPRYAAIYDANGRVIASGDRRWIGEDMTSLTDFKGRPLAQAMYDESRALGRGFAMYRKPDLPSMDKPADNQESARAPAQTRYAYFGYFAPWDWVVVVSDSVQDVIDQVELRRQQMNVAMRETLGELTLARSGCMFILADDGSMVAPPPSATGLEDGTDRRTGLTLKQTLQSITASERPEQLDYDDGDGRWIIEAVRFKPLGWTLAAVVPESDFTAPAMALLHRQAVVFAGTLLLALLIAWLFAIRIVRPLEQLTGYARQLPQQDLKCIAYVPDHIAALPRQRRDEVGRLAASFLFMDRRLRENIARLMQEASTRERYESELNIARVIQTGLLPVPPTADNLLNGTDLYALMLPAKEVGGDLYDYFMLPDDRVCVAIGDCSDKGVPAALFMAITRTLIRATAEDETDPARMLQRINNRLAENNPNMMFVTLLLGVLDLRSGQLSWANAGHPPPAIIDADGQARLLTDRSGPACGVIENTVYRPLTTQLRRGEVLVGYTDGVTEATGPDGALYSEKRLLARLCCPVKSSAGLALGIVQDLKQYAGGAEQSDDITLIVIRRP
ncbi:SpoIIE family protein phosphatase [Bordetella sp. N]|uniref:SpoIIE family protein phosphatase n=1 Tax=Bordetella sp. N TaxID=1746199 RepID=UPI001E6073C6|nr:SpoIIE family protein phosphatase [Bordetella sp. N]